MTDTAERERLAAWIEEYLVGSDDFNEEETGDFWSSGASSPEEER